MKKLFLLFTFILILSKSNAQVPNTDIWLLDITIVKDSITLKNPVNITKRTGYDNQPAFSPDGKYILYTSIREDKRAHIYKYDLKRKRSKQFTHTATSEYSPTFMPDGENISVVMVEPDSTQRLWKFPIAGGEPSVIMKNIDSIGYHCWITKDSIGLVMITNPPTLEVANINTEKHKVIAHDVGRCMSSEKQRLYYIQKPMDNFYYLYWSGIYVTQVPNEDYAYLQIPYQKLIFTGVKSKINVTYVSQRITLPIKDLSSFGIKNITRIAINSDATKLAIVAE